MLKIVFISQYKTNTNCPLFLRSWLLCILVKPKKSYFHKTGKHKKSISSSIGIYQNTMYQPNFARNRFSWYIDNLSLRINMKYLLSSISCISATSHPQYTTDSPSSVSVGFAMYTFLVTGSMLKCNIFRSYDII